MEETFKTRDTIFFFQHGELLEGIVTGGEGECACGRFRLLYVVEKKHGRGFHLYPSYVSKYKDKAIEINIEKIKFSLKENREFLEYSKKQRLFVEEKIRELETLLKSTKKR